MNFKEQFTTVTPLSKTIALALVVILPFIGFYAGVKYQQSITPLTVETDLLPVITEAIEDYTAPTIKPGSLHVEITGIKDDFVRFSVDPKPGIELDPAFGFAHKENGNWKILSLGTGGDPTLFYKQYNIPKELRDKGY